MKPALSRLPNVDVEAARASCPSSSPDSRQPKVRRQPSSQQPPAVPPTKVSFLMDGWIVHLYYLLHHVALSLDISAFSAAAAEASTELIFDQHPRHDHREPCVLWQQQWCCHRPASIYSILPPAPHSSALVCPGSRETMPWITRPLASCKLQRRSVGTCLKPQTHTFSCSDQIHHTINDVHSWYGKL